MEDFEQQLKNALARKEPSPSFERRVLAASTAAQARPRVYWSQWAYWSWLPALAAMILICAVFVVQQKREDRAAGEAAKARLQLALRITVAELAKVQKSVRTSTEE